MNDVKTKQIENCLLGLWLMNDIPPEKVDLHTWTIMRKRCGTIHCFGGWVAVAPEFKEQGVQAGFEGAPYMENEYQSTCNVAEKLFGDDGMFFARRQHMLDGPLFGKSDRDVVVNRLEAQIEKLTSRKKARD